VVALSYLHVCPVSGGDEFSIQGGGAKNTATVSAYWRYVKVGAYTLILSLKFFVGTACSETTGLQKTCALAR
jgi:hypothetical protein